MGEGTILPKINFQSEVFKMKGTAQHNMIKIINSISELYFNNIRTSVSVLRAKHLGYVSFVGVFVSCLHLRIRLQLENYPSFLDLEFRLHAEFRPASRTYSTGTRLNDLLPQYVIPSVQCA